MNINFSKLIIFAVLILFTACQTTNKSSSGYEEEEAKTIHSKDKVTIGSTVEGNTNSPTSQLVDYMRKLPGVMVRGSHPNVSVMIRGVKTSDGNTEPLYVLDNVPMGNNYAQVAGIVDVTRIKKVSVLKGAQAAIYGTQGSNGVIIITMKTPSAN
jgi:TonB-dependent SusC/RagA subfamily outer membrane receptor